MFTEPTAEQNKLFINKRGRRASYDWRSLVLMLKEREIALSQIPEDEQTPEQKERWVNLTGEFRHRGTLHHAKKQFGLEIRTRGVNQVPITLVQVRLAKPE